ncbi:MAG: phosphotransferase [Burkholderiales bacterium]|nr:phosphotransferase [Burkholderiales bacterium]MDE1927972.1 phosphotransferase [Burkholderiales bacterium]MDE2159152.1 phosphotransferase [Burkholderiales bacterium]MDE2501621.1 phosphotransferase [Burkholderiales bacterium]
MREIRSPIAGPDAARQAAFGRWLARVAPRHGVDPTRIAPAAGPGHGRQVWRIEGAPGSVIAIDAPPPHDIRPRLHAAALLQDAGIDVPPRLDAALEQGFLLLADYGSVDLLDAQRALPPAQAEALWRQALATLVQLETRIPAQALPPLAAQRYADDLALFPLWCVERAFGIRWSDAEHAAWQRVATALSACALALPVVAVHGDFAPRQLRVRPGGTIGVLGAGDAHAGPIGLDLAALLRDGAPDDEAQELDRAIRWWEQARRAGLPVEADFGAFWRAHEWLGLLRDLTQLGRDCRASQRDGGELEAGAWRRRLGRAGQVALRYAPLKPLLRLLEPLSGARVASGFTF